MLLKSTLGTEMVLVFFLYYLWNLGHGDLFFFLPVFILAGSCMILLMYLFSDVHHLCPFGKVNTKVG